jgi:hypothetical protein
MASVGELPVSHFRREKLISEPRVEEASYTVTRSVQMWSEKVLTGCHVLTQHEAHGSRLEERE